MINPEKIEFKKRASRGPEVNQDERFKFGQNRKTLLKAIKEENN